MNGFTCNMKVSADSGIHTPLLLYGQIFQTPMGGIINNVNMYKKIY